MERERMGMIRRMHAARGGEEGFTLIEVLIALGILSFGLLGVVGMFVTAIGGNSKGKNMTEATSLAQSKLDYQANAVVFDALTSGTESNGKYTIRWTQNAPIGSPIGRNLRKITVTVTWTTKGEPHTVELSTLRAKG